MQGWYKNLSNYLINYRVLAVSAVIIMHNREDSNNS